MVNGADEGLSYDRQLLLNGPKRNSTLALWEVQRYGTDSYADPDYVSIYGLRPAEWYSRGIRILGRTAVECTRDSLADAIGTKIAAAASAATSTGAVVVIDPFAGSGNTLYWIMRHLSGARGVGFELDDVVFELTRQNLSMLELPIEVLHSECSLGLAAITVATDELVVAFLAPPWGEALSASTGLDLRRTTPPVVDIVDSLVDRFDGRLLCAIQVHERVEPASLAEVEARFDWSELLVFDLSAQGDNHGILLAGRTGRSVSRRR
jgi:hypothetical protein